MAVLQTPQNKALPDQALWGIVIGMYKVRREQPPGHLQNKELIPMADKIIKTKPKRLSKGQRIHVRRLKQAARKAGTPHS